MTSTTKKKQTTVVANNKKTKKKVDIPKQWTADIIEQYEPIKELGRGGFATVVLARKKKKSTTTTKQEENSTTTKATSNNNNNTTSTTTTTTTTTIAEGTLVAMKVVGSLRPTNKHNREYAHREIEILQELSHPNIMQCYDYWESKPTKKGSVLYVAIMALSYEVGPTLEKLLRHGGKLSFVCCRVITAQLIDAIAYMHNRACVHRDIKPDNIVITGANFTQDDIWDDHHLPTNHDNNHHHHPNENHPTLSSDVLVSYRNRWIVKLIDFGFARALTPSDFEKPHPDKSSVRTGVDGFVTGDSSTHSRVSFNKSRHLVRKMSAVGNQLYAAPEIVQGVFDEFITSTPDDTSGSSRYNNNTNTASSKSITNHHHPIDVTKNLSEHVSFYGLMADAYSIGITLKYMLTGVPADENVDDRIALENNPIICLCKLLFGCCGSGTTKIDEHALDYDNEDDKQDNDSGTQTMTTNNNNNKIRVVKYRRLSQIPAEPYRLLKGLMNVDPLQRTTVSAARSYPWIDEVLVGYPEIDRSTIHYLSLTLKDTNKPTTTNNTTTSDETKKIDKYDTTTNNNNINKSTNTTNDSSEDEQGTEIIETAA